jgi:Protein of unknown function (DUF3027)
VVTGPDTEPPGGHPPAGPATRVSPRLADAVEVARQAAEADAGGELVGEYVGVQPEEGGAATHLFEAHNPGYLGWRWAVTVASAGPDDPVTVSEVVLLPGSDALVSPEWVPWQQRIRAGDLGIGDLLVTPGDDPRLVPGYLANDDLAVEETSRELGLGRVRVLSREGRLQAAERWYGGDFGPHSDMARTAPGACGTCGFYLPLAGSLRAAFGVCGNQVAPADGHVVHVEYGCGAHSEVRVETTPMVPVAELAYDDAGLDVEPSETVAAQGDPAEPDSAAAEIETAAGPVETAAAVADVAAAAPVVSADPIVSAAPTAPVAATDSDAEVEVPADVEVPAAEAVSSGDQADVDAIGADAADSASDVAAVGPTTVDVSGDVPAPDDDAAEDGGAGSASETVIGDTDNPGQ